MPLLCFRIISYSQRLVTDQQYFKFKANALKSNKTIKEETHRSFSFLGPVDPLITSHSQCPSKFLKTIQLNRISTEFLIVQHLKDVTLLKKFPVSHQSPLLLWFQGRRSLLLWYVLSATVHPVYFPAKK